MTADEWLTQNATHKCRYDESTKFHPRQCADRMKLASRGIGNQSGVFVLGNCAECEGPIPIGEAVETVLDLSPRPNVFVEARERKERKLREKTHPDSIIAHCPECKKTREVKWQTFRIARAHYPLKNGMYTRICRACWKSTKEFTKETKVPVSCPGCGAVREMRYVTAKLYPLVDGKRVKTCLKCSGQKMLDVYCPECKTTRKMKHVSARVYPVIDGVRTKPCAHCAGRVRQPSTPEAKVLRRREAKKKYSKAKLDVKCPKCGKTRQVMRKHWFEVKRLKPEAEQFICKSCTHTKYAPADLIVKCPDCEAERRVSQLVWYKAQKKGGIVRCPKCSKKRASEHMSQFWDSKRREGVNEMGIGGNGVGGTRRPDADPSSR